MAHIPVLLNEVIKFLNPKPGDVILDATIGNGGHARAILKHILPNGKLVGIEQDKQILDTLNFQNNVILINGNFRDLDRFLVEKTPTQGRGSDRIVGVKKLDGALFDLGMNSLQLEQSGRPACAGRGFTFQKDEPLLMTYKFPIGSEDLTAHKILNEWPEKDIADILYRYGEERHARRVARNIVERRKKRPFKTTFELVDVIMKSVPFRHYYKTNPATKTFQALRIAVNDELNALTESLERTWQFLNYGGRIVIISFHSLEDRIVKNFLRDKNKEGVAEILTKKPIVPLTEEIAENPRARSAKLRAAIKVKNQR